MKKLLLITTLSLSANIIFAQLTGIKTIPGDYATIQSAITTLNVQGVGSGGVTFNVAAGHSESASATILLTATGTASDQIIFQKSGTGADPLITRTGSGSIGTSIPGGHGDAIVIIQGSDYVTFDGISITAGNAGIEYGYYLRKASSTDGCKFITIKNADITLTKANYVIGIYTSNNDPGSSPGSADGIVITSTGGRHENVTITGNTIKNVNYGIYLRGYRHMTSPHDYYDQNFVIGMSGQGNIIQNFNNTISTSGIWAIYHKNIDISWNTIDNIASGGTTATSALTGISISDTNSSAGSLTVSHNSINLSQGSTSAANGINIGQTGCAINVNNNSFSYGTFNSAANSYLIYINNNSNDVTVNDNQTSGSISLTGTGTLDCYYKTGNPTGGTETISNNNFSNITISSGNGTLAGIYTNSPTTQSRICSNNTLSNFNHNGTGNVYGMAIQSLVSSQINGNSIGDLTTGGNSLVGINVEGKNASVYSNTVSNLNSNGGDALHGLYFAVDTSFAYDNNINTLVSSGASVNGFYISTFAFNHFNNNKIYNLMSSHPEPAVSGVYIHPGTRIFIYNNIISDLKAPNANSVNAIIGIKAITVLPYSNLNVFYNTIFICATSSGANFGTCGIWHNSNTSPTTASLDLRNNLIINTSVANGSGLTVALRRSSTALNNYASVSNNNDLYAGVPGPSNLIYYDGTNADQTLASYQARVAPRDSESFTENPPFVNISTAPFDLHLQSTVGTYCESGGTNISSPVNIQADFDGDTRNATYPDVGADEFSGIELYPPDITYTPLPNTSLITDRTVANITITDGAGINTSSGTKPRIYFKRKQDANEWNDNTSNTNGWKWQETSGSASPFDFTTAYSKLFGGSGVSIGDTIQYFIIAQDLAPIPHVGINSGNLANPPATVALTSTAFPIGGAINSYTIMPGYSGPYYVGSGQTFRSLTADADSGFFKALNNGIVTGNITAYIVSDLNESGAVALNQWLEEGTGNYSLTIKPDTAQKRIISGSYPGGLIRLAGSDRVTFDGFYASDSINYLDIINTSQTGTIAGFQVISQGNNQGSNNITIRNCNISCGHKNSGSYAIAIGGASLGSTGADNDSITISNNKITRAYIGILAKGSASTNPGMMDDLAVLNNDIGSELSSEYISHDGIILSNGNNADVYGNTIFNILNSASTPVGITISTGFVNASVSGNAIYNINYTGTQGYGGRGMYINTGNTSSNLVIYNNLVYQIGGDGWYSFSNSSPVGIYVDGSTGGLNIYFNSVFMSGPVTKTLNVKTTAILFNSASQVTIDLRNNIFMNEMDNGNSTTDLHYAIYSLAPANSFLNIDYNDYFANSPQGILAYFTGANQTTIEAIRIATGQDTHSHDLDPLFNSDTVLIPGNDSLNNLGYYLEAVPEDYSGNHRSNPSDIGAFEFGDIPVPLQSESVIGSTYYDLQSNKSLGNRLAFHPDGTIGAVWTRGFEVSTFPDRGAGYNYFDGTNWDTLPLSRIESVRCGWPSYDTWGNNGEILVSHNGSTGLQINKRSTHGTGAWTETTFQGPSGTVLTWPRVVTSGTNHEWIHMISNTNSPYSGQSLAVLYSRSNDGGTTWDPENIILPGTGSEFYRFFEGDEYTMAARGNIVAILFSQAFKDMFILKSDDNGSTWTKTIIWQHPYPMFDWDTTMTAEFFSADNSSNLAIGPDGKIHVVFGISKVIHASPGTTYNFSTTDGIGYWNEDMPAFSNDLDALAPPDLNLPNSEMVKDYNYIGWSQDMNGDSTISFISTPSGWPMAYRSTGISTMPSVLVDDNNQVFVVFASTTETYDNGNYNFKKIWGRACLNQNWGEFIHITSDPAHDEMESVYPVLAPGSDDLIHMIFQEDNSPGTALDGNHNYHQNQIIYAKIPKYEFLSPNNFIWTGNVSSEWNESGNWSAKINPGMTSRVWIPGTAVNQPIINNNIACGKITLQQGSNLLVDKGMTLNLHEGLEIQTGTEMGAANLNIKGILHVRHGLPPVAPSAPSPENGSIYQGLTVTMRWTCNDPEGDSLFYDIYLSADSSSLNLIAANVDTSLYMYTDTLIIPATYFWKVIAKDVNGNATASSVWQFTTTQLWETCGDSVYYESDLYHTIPIGAQCWMKENLKVGTELPYEGWPSNNNIIEKWCYDSDCQTYGGYYDWNEVMKYIPTNGAQGICPSGWHVPTDEEWKVLEGTVDSQYGVGDTIWDETSYRGFDAGLNIKMNNYWMSGCDGTNDIYGFSAMPNGYKSEYISNTNSDGSFWTSTVYGENYAYIRFLNFCENGISRGYTVKWFGSAVRCLKD